MTGNQKVRSLRQVGDDVAAFNILTNTDNQGMLITLSSARAKNVSQCDSFSVRVWNLNTDCRFPGNRRKNSHVCRGHGIGNVLRKVCQAIDLHPWPQGDFVTCHCRAAGEAGHLGINIKFCEHLTQCLHDLIIDRRASLMGRTAYKKFT